MFEYSQYIYCLQTESTHFDLRILPHFGPGGLGQSLNLHVTIAFRKQINYK